MISLKTSDKFVYCFTLVAFLLYLLAAAVFALPAQPQECTRSKHPTSTAHGKPGTFCTLTYNTRPALSAHGQSPSPRTIVLCAQGCGLLHPNQRIVSSVAKFMSTDIRSIACQLVINYVPKGTLPVPLAPYLPSPYHPPSARA